MRPVRRATALLLAGLVAASTLGSLWYADWAGAATTTIVATSNVTPKAVSVAPGTIVTFRNDDGERHRFRTDDGAPARFDVDLDAGESASVTLVVLGTYTYRDDRDRSNPAYAGTVTVTASPTTTTTQPPGGGGSTTTVPAPTRADVQVLDRSFSPASVSVTAGSTVVWTNTSGRDHTVTADNGSFSSPTFASGTYQRTFPSPGSFAYFCQLHPEMRGVVTVGAAGSPPPATTPPPPPPPTTPPPPPPPIVPGAAPGTPGAAPANRTMQIIDFAFRPSSIDAQVGDTIVFANDGQAPHTATARGGTFDTGTIAAGGRRSVRMGTAGTFSIFCTIHPAMTGTVRVVDASGAAPAEPAGGAAADGSGAGAGTGSDAADPGDEGDAPPERGEVAVLDFEFRPPVVEVEVGAEVRWSFEGEAPHTVTSTDDRFDSGILETGDTFTERFDEVGMFRYLCQLHPQMTGAVKVLEPEDPAPDLAASAGGSIPGRVSQNIGFAILSAAVLLGATSLLLLAAKRFVRLAD